MKDPKSQDAKSHLYSECASQTLKRLYSEPSLGGRSFIWSLWAGNNENVSDLRRMIGAREIFLQLVSRRSLTLAHLSQPAFRSLSAGVQASGFRQNFSPVLLYNMENMFVVFKYFISK